MIKKICISGSFALLIALILAVGFVPTAATHAATAHPTSTGNGATTGWAHVRSGPNTNSTILRTDAPGTQVSILKTVQGENVWGNTNIWDEIANGQYIYSSLVGTASNNQPAPAPGGSAPSSAGRVIDVNLSTQWLHAYDNGREVFNTPVATGRAALPTPTGDFHVFLKLSPTTFYSPWPQGSPYYYAPTYIETAMEFKAGGYFLHAADWKANFGPGTNAWHYDTRAGWIDGTHGCVTMSVAASAWLYSWTPNGTLVHIHY